jgi:hypothetical protein
MAQFFDSSLHNSYYMKKNTFVQLALMLILLPAIISCSKKKVMSQDKKSTPQIADSAALIKTIDINEAYQPFDKTDPFTTLSSRINGDTLLIEVQYGGGCEEHKFTLHTNKMWMKSLPPQLNLWLEHDSSNDMCRALLTETLKFDIKPLQYPSSKTVEFILNGDRENRVRYAY